MKAKDFVNALSCHGIDYITGVPDSLLKGFCSYAERVSAEGNYTICANEGLAVSLAAGYQLATNSVPLVFLQNSGLGNTINPILSLIHRDVYHIPMLFLIGWRGEPGVKDEPQHKSQGAATIPILDAVGMRHAVLNGDTESMRQIVAKAADYIATSGESFALIVRKGAFDEEPESGSKPCSNTPVEMSREEAIALVCGLVDQKAMVVASTGMISRELYSFRESSGGGHAADFLTVGSMGHCSTIALGLALNRPDREFVCLDGDGALLMHMGGMALIGRRAPCNLTHVVLNNYSHDSVGGQPTGTELLDIPALASGCGYAFAQRATTKDQVIEFFSNRDERQGVKLLEVVVAPGHRNDLPRPRETPRDNKILFTRRLQQG
jgi:phosphonopyruvate decarboxylase